MEVSGGACSAGPPLKLCMAAGAGPLDPGWEGLGCYRRSERLATFLIYHPFFFFLFFVSSPSGFSPFLSPDLLFLNFLSLLCHLPCHLSHSRNPQSDSLRYPHLSAAPLPTRGGTPTSTGLAPFRTSSSYVIPRTPQDHGKRRAHGR